MTTAAGSGYVERIGNWWYLRRRASVLDPTTGRSVQRQGRVRLGPTKRIRTVAAAREIADAYLARLAAPTLEPGLATTFREYSERFIRDHVQLLRESSRRRYRSVITLLQGQLGADPLATIDAPELQSVITKLSADRAPATMRTVRAMALQILRQARADGFGAHVVETRAIKLPKATKPARERVSWTRDELERILAATHLPWSALWGLMGYAGLRAGEVLALTWSDIDFERREIRIRGNATREGIMAPKTASSAATLPMLPRVHELLCVLRSNWRTNVADLLFPNRNGRTLNPDELRARKLQPLLASLNLPTAGLHSFRHSTPAILAGMGLNFDAIRVYMRHSDLRMTERYLHTTVDHVRAAIDAATARESRLQASATGTSP